MHESIRKHFAKLDKAIRTTAVPAQRKASIAGYIVKLSDLYTQYRLTNESRYGDEITRLVQGVLNELAACPDAQKLDAEFRSRLHLLHEELGVPTLPLKPSPPPPKAPKAPKQPKK